MIKGLYRKANRFRKKAYLNSLLFKSNKKYAFVGFGIHSVANLFPVLDHLGICLKYICTKKSIVGKNIHNRFPRSAFINSMDIILEDPEVEGVFVSAYPEDHAQLLGSLLQAGKKVFIEKPPCSNSAELEKIINMNPGSVVEVGLQRRYWPGNRYLLENKEKASSYIYRFYFGPYPQGDVFNELFIHAIDYCIFLFGDFSVLSSSHQKYDNGITTQMHVKHSKGISGLIELSTHNSWNDPVDSLSIQCTDELLEVRYPVLIEGTLKPNRILNLPVERILHKPQITKKYFSVNNMIIPSFDLNTLVLQGFYDEMLAFATIVENGKQFGYENDLIKMRPVFRILDELKESAYRTA
jgi:virulence factor